MIYNSMQKTGLDAFYLPDHDLTIVSHQHWKLCPIYVYLCFVILKFSETYCVYVDRNLFQSVKVLDN